MEVLMKEIKKILLPIDFSEGAMKILRYADYFATLTGAHLFIVHVAEWPYSLSGFPPHGQETQFQDNVRMAEKRLEGFIEENSESIGASLTSEVLTGHVAETILDYAAKKDIDLIAIGTHGRTGFERLLLGSVAEKVLKLATCPVLTVSTFKEEEGEASN
jgi:nucleotide-binding universal stress UspA family protein